MIRSEKRHAANPYKTYIGWGVFYVAVIAGAIYGFLQFASAFHTHSAPTGSVELHVPYGKYLVGEPIGFSVTNNYTTTISITNNCPGEPLAVYKLVKKTWERIHATSKKSTCEGDDRFITIQPGKTVSGSYKNWSSLFKNPGKYRIAVHIPYFNSVAYQDFSVVKKPVVKKTTKKKTTGTTTPVPITVPAPTNTSPSVHHEDDDDDEDEHEQQSSGGSSSSSSQSATIPVGSKGTVVLSYTSSQITVVSVAPSSGCWYEGRHPGYVGSFIEITFKCGGETQLQAWLSGGTLRTKIEND